MKPEMTEAILSRAREREADLIQFLQDLVRIPSFSGQEGAVIERIRQEMERLGYDEIRVDELGNLMGRVGNGPRTLALDGHCDVVDVGNPDLWSVEPFGAEIRDGKLWGRGASDQKAGLACAVYAGALLQQLGPPEELSLWVVASVMEEDCDGLCWKYILDHQLLKPEAVLITEPTSLQIYRGQRGRMEMKVKTVGRSAHGSAPERGDNAIYKMAPIIQQVQQLHPRLREHPILGKGSVTISDIRSTAPSLCAVADSCTIHLDRRLTIGESLESSLAEIRNLPGVQQSGARVWVPEYRERSYTGTVYPMEKYYPTWLLEEKHPVLGKAVETYQSLFQKKAVVGCWTFSTNGVGIMGLYGVPTFGLGPGMEEQAHAPDEHVPLEHLVPALAFYTAFALNYV